MAHIKIQSTHPSLLKAMICIALEREKKMICVQTGWIIDEDL